MAYFGLESEEVLTLEMIRGRLRALLTQFDDRSDLYTFFEQRNGERLIRPIILETIDQDLIINFYYPDSDALLNVNIVLDYKQGEIENVYYGIGFSTQDMHEILRATEIVGSKTAWGYRENVDSAPD